MSNKYTLKWLTDKYENGETIKYIFFWGNTKNQNETIDKTCFSQWYESPFIIGSITYLTAEHWMMAQKALLFEDMKCFNKIIASKNPGEAKELGRQVIGFDEQVWNDNRFEIVKNGNIHKFNQNKSLGEYLTQTQERVIVEASPVDTIWGIGLSQDSKDIDNVYCWRGLNLLGFALMEARDFLTEFGNFEPISNQPKAPWNEFPEIGPTDMFWRMGKGEGYLDEFYDFYDNLSEREKTIYDLTNPTPYFWKKEL